MSDNEAGMIPPEPPTPGSPFTCPTGTFQHPHAS